MGDELRAVEVLQQKGIKSFDVRENEGILTVSFGRGTPVEDIIEALEEEGFYFMNAYITNSPQSSLKPSVFPNTAFFFTFDPNILLLKKKGESNARKR